MMRDGPLQGPSLLHVKLQNCHFPHETFFIIQSYILLTIKIRECELDGRRDE